MEHPYAQVLRWIADGEKMEMQMLPYVANVWDFIAVADLLEAIGEGGALPPDRYRRKPRTIDINGHEVPEPMRVAPAEGADYFTVNMEDGDVDSWRLQWQSGTSDMRRFKAGLCHATREAAEAHARALLSFTTQESA